MLRVRFRANIKDPRPVHWPPKHPYWITGEVMWSTKRTAYASVVSYADDEDYIYEHWPDASHLKAREVDDYQFTDRFPQPDWWPIEERERRRAEIVISDRIHEDYRDDEDGKSLHYWCDYCGETGPNKIGIEHMYECPVGALEAKVEEIERLRESAQAIVDAEFMPTFEQMLALREALEEQEGPGAETKN